MEHDGAKQIRNQRHESHCRETGGVDFDAQKTDLSKSFAEIEEELRSSYELAYHSPNAGDGTFHKVVVRSKRPGIVIRAKAGYFAGGGS